MNYYTGDRCLDALPKAPYGDNSSYPKRLDAAKAFLATQSLEAGSHRFQGVWLGSIIGAALENNLDPVNRSEYDAIIQYQFSSWLKVRELIAQQIIQGRKIEAQYILEQLTPFLRDLNNIHERRASIISYINILLTLLPLITLTEDNRDIYLEAINKCNFESVNVTQLTEDISLWTYLLTMAKNDRFKPKDTNISMIVKQVVDNVGVKTTSSIEKLKIVSQAWEHGSSLKQLTEKLCLIDNLNYNAMPTATDVISLSFYCFASTPRNFMLSVKRASNLSSNLALPVTALTATLSGAYNGLAAIPRDWQIAANHNLGFQQASQTVQQLNRIWLGIHNTGDRDLLYDSQIHAVAVPRAIQVRQTLKIISQKY